MKSGTIGADAFEVKGGRKAIYDRKRKTNDL